MKILNTCFAMLGAGALLVAAKPAQAVMIGDYYKIPVSHPDVQSGIDGNIVTGLVANSLGPNGLPVATAFAKTRAAGSGAISALNNNDELLWWNAGSFGVLHEKVQADATPLNFPSNFFVDGANNNSTHFRAVHWKGTFSLAAPQLVNFKLQADDDAWLFVNGQLAADNGGVKAMGKVTNVNVNFGAGLHHVDLFFADRNTVQSGLKLESNVEIVPEPSTVLALAGGVVGFIRFRRRS